ncbi:MAG: 4-(cytidine 5'-diphospho)-2-C-methyl-D-erythritol kinase [Bacteroidetes bacterium]|nr:MAG: 4-(cytidine 5'-diphospho)-2-C-methyl-D-erythritol kinase [Bacteroidota bacterium]
MITFPACKINIGLNIISKRSDGFHSIETVFYPIQWADILEIVPGAQESNTVDFRSTGLRLFGPKDKNLCLRAYQLLSEKFNIPSVKMHLHKVLPIGAGLGGGSSDAASTLMLLNKIFKLGASEEELESIAASIGSDCSFFIRNKPMMATGKGEILKPISLKLKNYFIVIVKPRAHISTAEAYASVKPSKPKFDLSEQIQRPISEWKDFVVNDFEHTIFEKHPGIKNIKNKMYKLGALYASMSGSGSSVYGIFSNEKNLSAYFRSCTVWQGYL